ncbi:uncharacterized protein LACBIDRAFT_299679 [Laccaria bicolor S238N-H82]|uniref:Predicted protein n=1 Tax=Laccaria bicolor (strain S238N-H82 / ATCC MYA-4686) TaxID=486041 RepID=B0DF57_LACBS|nr:uncharacterized protein LACBIDRAFT_299679 [Laccaria bicolor S238N-H82]EDR06798.1 predicted protein [Laccaria bicolor S238N-H82]|eukprot:XP_001882645.1 predicted protein [Laccaria bicolor S238N-H82]
MPPTDSIGCSEYQVGEWVLRHFMPKCPLSLPCPPPFRKVLGMPVRPSDSINDACEIYTKRCHGMSTILVNPMNFFVRAALDHR